MIKKTRHIEDTTKILDSLPTMIAPIPEYIFIATDNARCPKADVYINPGDHVNYGQVIGLRHGGFFDQPIHSTCSGTFEGFEKHYHRSGKQVNFFKIHNDFKDTLDPSIKDRTDEEIANLSKEDMVEIIKNCACVGLGGSSFPTYIKFGTDKHINTILINGIECEPYLTADHRIMLELPEDLIEGIKLIQQAFKCHDARICIKSKYKDIKAVYGELLKRYKDDGITLSCVKNYYPQGWEIAMIKEATGIKVESGKLPMDYGIIDFNVSTVISIYHAIKHNMPVMERRIAVTGEGIKYPSNFIVRVGTPIKALIEKCGGYNDEDKPKAFILGGPMMGVSEPNDDLIITKTVTSLIVLNHIEYKEDPCIRCGSCVLSCPVSLKPVDIMNTMKSMPVDKQKIKELNPLKCIECGLCSYSCTSEINVTDYVKRAKVIARLP